MRSSILPRGWRGSSELKLHQRLAQRLAEQTQNHSGHREFPGVQWLGLCTSTARAQGSISRWGTETLQARPTVKNKKGKKLVVIVRPP